MTAPVVAIDGPSGAGKSTVARAVASRLALPFVDTGAMYRTLALEALRRAIDLRDPAAIDRLVHEARIEIGWSESRGFEVRLNGELIGDEIRSEEVSNATSKLSVYPQVRQLMIALQRDFGHRYGGVFEGRDIGSVVFPSTPHKFYLDASDEIRARRRHRQLEDAGQAAELETIRHELESRDRRDRDREHSPLVVDDSYRRIDSSEIAVDEVVDLIASQIEADRDRL